MPDINHDFNTTSSPPAALSLKAGKYTYDILPGEKEKGVYFPDSVVDPFIHEVNAALQGSAKRAEKTTPVTGGKQPMFSLEEIRRIIQTALNEFDTDLGKKAEAIFNAGFFLSIFNIAANPDHKINPHEVKKNDKPVQWRLEKSDPVPEGGDMIQRTLRANNPNGDLPNPNPYTVIDFQFDGTMESLVYIAHELGHAIADGNLQRDGKNKASDSPIHMEETQAYFVQNILYGYISRHPELEDKYPGIVQASSDHLANAMKKQYKLYLSPDYNKNERIHYRLGALLSGMGLYNAARDATPAIRKKAINAVLCGEGPKNIVQAFAAAGIKTPEAMQRIAHGVVHGEDTRQKPRRGPAPPP
jgi:hypothetical protein